ncbi:unnamed protein product [Boreogadus saida]
MSTKKHRAMGSEEWVSRLKAFASSGTWPSRAGNRPSPKQAKWPNHYQKHSIRYPTSSDAPFQSQLLQACLPFLSASIQPCHVGGEDQLFSSG